MGKTKWDEFNPIAITFIPWWKRKALPFWTPFRDFKHGKERPTPAATEAQLLELLKTLER